MNRSVEVDGPRVAGRARLAALRIRYSRPARVAVTASATRGQGSRVVVCARDFLGTLKLRRFGTRDKRSEEMPDLPRWPGVRYLDPQTSAAYQAAALVIARRHGVSRVHLDAFWWGGRE